MYGIFMECWVALKLYFGGPMLAILLVASAIYIIVAEKDLKKKILLGILPIVILAGFLLPVTKIVYVAAFDESDTYYRVLWLVPVYVVIGYAACKLVFSFENKMKQRIALVAALVVVVLSGHLVYLNQYMSVAQNLYHIPQHVIEICDVIAPADGEDRVRAAFPSELVHFVRQYDTNILMPFGREMVVTQWDYYNPVYEVMEKPEIIDAEELLEATRQTGCRFIVLAKDRKINKNLTTLGLKLIKTIDKYYIYEDPQMSS